MFPLLHLHLLFRRSFLLVAILVHGLRVHSFGIITPVNPLQCYRWHFNLTGSGHTHPPYTLSVVLADQTDASPIAVFQGLRHPKTMSWRLQTNVSAGTILQATMVDSANASATTYPFTVNNSSRTDCLTQLSTLDPEPDPEPEKHRLSPAAIAGISVACALALGGALVLFVVLYRRYKRKNRLISAEKPLDPGINLYFISFSPMLTLSRYHHYTVSIHVHNTESTASHWKVARVASPSNKRHKQSFINRSAFVRIPRPRPM